MDIVAGYLPFSPQGADFGVWTHGDDHLTEADAVLPVTVQAEFWLFPSRKVNRISLRISTILQFAAILRPGTNPS